MHLTRTLYWKEVLWKEMKKKYKYLLLFVVFH
jgi:hypothetical protein